MEQCKRTGRPLPSKIANAPQLMLGLELYVDAWLDLESCRSAGWSLNPIAWTTLVEYARILDLDEEGLGDFLFIMRKMDDAYVKWHRDREEKKRKNGN